MNDFSHLDETGKVSMVDVTDKMPTCREALAEGAVFLAPETLAAIQDAALPKGDVLTTAKIAGVMAAKRTAELIPMCHPLNISFVDVRFSLQNDRILISATAKTREATGVEMEALTAVSVAALTIYDMCKSADKTMRISDIRLVRKTGGKSSHKTTYRPRTGVLVLSDSISAGEGEDKSGKILKAAFEREGCEISHYEIIPDDVALLSEKVGEWINGGTELVMTSGGTGMGPRDITVETLAPKFSRRLPGVEQALHAYGVGKTKTAMLSRLTAGVIKNSIVVCLPGSTGAAKDALAVLIPTVFHAFHMMQGEKHSATEK
ncbi:molybdenum cofactor biosynthesis protein C [Chloroherpeton thalassium ATCC 35110]|uniref:Cyclic pyranopterin monophosphate synthase n=1 Tax=Chloroherpeton thalassium (strain ATCC 35110 / GB-78) TaxID=517418 RepID=B3QWW7_CHLT3|nr:bifunctional molybdenum cofactor biosynthesis protein MoaC/MoaB [Chloroherpeton thalassium]ACF13331.1 molybdenum cofactor biosynthesis protein C [Chloroherpeton thalassium ATCC 35110]